MAARPALSGDFADLAPGDLLGLLGAGGKSGIVRCTGARATDIALHQGEVTWAESGSGAQLEAIVRAAGSADAATIDEAVASARRSGSLAGALLDAGVEQQRVSDVLLDHTTSELAELVSLGAGSFEFFEGATHALGAELSWPVALVLATVEERVRGLAEQREVVPSDAAPVLLAELPPGPGGDEAPVVLQPDEWRVAVAVGDGRGVAAIAGRTGWSPYRVRGIVCHLVARNLMAVGR